jgi:hypothetical protein
MLAVSNILNMLDRYIFRDMDLAPARLGHGARRGAPHRVRADLGRRVEAMNEMMIGAIAAASFAAGSSSSASGGPRTTASSSSSRSRSGSRA